MDVLAGYMPILIIWTGAVPRVSIGCYYII
jgi:hypothetical protein